MVEATAARVMVADWNKRIYTFMEEDFPLLLKGEGIKVEGGKIAMGDYFRARAVADRQGFYEIGSALVKLLREEGYNVKMDMQTYKLLY